MFALTVASSSMYSYDYDFTFQPVAVTAYDDTQIKQSIAHHIVANYPLYATSLNINDITTTAATAATVGTNKFVYTIGKATNDPSNGKTCTTITVKRYLPNGDNAPIEDAKFSVKDLTVGSYVWDNANKGLICYYRINIFDKDKAKTDAMYFSVIRNNAYHVNITGVSSIGYPEPGDVTVEPETPLIDFPTYMQVEITINQWTSKDMNTEIGM